MRWTSVLAIFTLFWVMSAFLALPFGIKSDLEAGSVRIPGQERGAPANFSPKKVLFRATILAIILFGLFYLNYVNGWITSKSLDFLMA
jgi:predicted secreted protein